MASTEAPGTRKGARAVPVWVESLFAIAHERRMLWNPPPLSWTAVRSRHAHVGHENGHEPCDLVGESGAEGGDSGREAWAAVETENLMANSGVRELIIENRHTGERLAMRRVKRGNDVWLEVKG